MGSRARIMRRMGINTTTPEGFSTLIANLKTIVKRCGCSDLSDLASWDAPVLPSIGRLDRDDLRTLCSVAKSSEMSIRECQVIVQKLPPRNERKRYAAYYTVYNGVNLMAS